MDRLDLALGQHFGNDLVNSDLGGNRLCSAAVVTGDHDDIDAHCLQGVDGLDA
ncbi:hypothetical protein D3C71_312090 [compost metagenome]